MTSISKVQIVKKRQLKIKAKRKAVTSLIPFLDKLNLHDITDAETTQNLILGLMKSQTLRPSRSKFSSTTPEIGEEILSNDDWQILMRTFPELVCLTLKRV